MNQGKRELKGQLPRRWGWEERREKVGEGERDPPPPEGAVMGALDLGEDP